VSIRQRTERADANAQLYD